MDNLIESIKARLSDEPALLKKFEEILDAPRERNEIYMYCFQRETLNGKIHYIPLITIIDGEQDLMACWDIHVLQEDYEKEVRKYKTGGYPLCIIEIPFWKYLNLRDNILPQLNSKKSKTPEEQIKRIKTELLFWGLLPTAEECTNDFMRKIFSEKSYCKCLDEEYNIIDCVNYKPIKKLKAI